MGTINVSEHQDKNFGKCIKIENGVAEILVTTDFGPRIIHYSLAGHDNVMYQDTAMAPIGEPYPEFGGDVFRLYGGHRLWFSPEILPRCYHPDNEPAEWSQTHSGAVFTAAIEKYNGIEKSMHIRLDGATVEVQHQIRNCNLWDIELAPWAITMLAAGGAAYMPMTGKKTGLLPNRHMVFWDYTDPSDARLTFGNDFVTLRQDATAATPLKLGYFNNSPNAGIRYSVKGQIFHKQAATPAGEYPDYGCNYEVFTNNEFLEAESLGPLTKLAPGEIVHHSETWSLSAEE